MIIRYWALRFLSFSFFFIRKHKALETIARYQNSSNRTLQRIEQLEQNVRPRKRVQSTGSNVTSEESRSLPRSRKKNRRQNHASSFREFISNRHLWIALTRGWNPCGWIPFLRFPAPSKHVQPSLSHVYPHGVEISFRARLYASLGSPSLIRDAG